MLRFLPTVALLVIGCSGPEGLADGGTAIVGSGGGAESGGGATGGGGPTGGGSGGAGSTGDGGAATVMCAPRSFSSLRLPYVVQDSLAMTVDAQGPLVGYFGPSRQLNVIRPGGPLQTLGVTDLRQLALSTRPDGTGCLLAAHGFAGVVHACAPAFSLTELSDAGFEKVRDHLTFVELSPTSAVASFEGNAQSILVYHRRDGGWTEQTSGALESISVSFPWDLVRWEGTALGCYRRFDTGAVGVIADQQGQLVRRYQVAHNAGRCQLATDGPRAVAYVVAAGDAGVFVTFGALTPNGPLAATETPLLPPGDVAEFDLAMRGLDTYLVWTGRGSNGGIGLARLGDAGWEAALVEAPPGRYERPLMAFDSVGGLHIAAYRVDDSQVYAQSTCPP